MSSDWAIALLGALIIGWSVVGVVTAPGRLGTSAMLALAAGVVLTASSIGALSTSLGQHVITPGIALTFIGISLGYWTAAVWLSSLGRHSDRLHAARSQTTRQLAPPSILLVNCAPPATYSPRSEAIIHRMLRDDESAPSATVAFPLTLLSQRTRFRSAGAMLTSAPSVTSLAGALQDSLVLAGSTAIVVAADCVAAPLLAKVASDARDSGTTTMRAVMLQPENDPVARYAHRLADSTRAQGGPLLDFAPSIWRDDRLAERLRERVIEACQDTPLADVGVILALEGHLAVYPSATDDDAGQYFAQRVRLFLSRYGLQEAHVRIAWIREQTPDVTEAVRHIAALGCERIVIAPATAVLPTLQTTLDLNAAVTHARLDPNGPEAVVLEPWGSDPGLIDALTRAVLGS